MNKNYALSLTFVMRFKAIGHFQVPVNLIMRKAFHMKLKLVLFAYNMNEN